MKKRHHNPLLRTLRRRFPAGLSNMALRKFRFYDIDENGHVIGSCFSASRQRVAVATAWEITDMALPSDNPLWRYCFNYDGVEDGVGAGNWWLFDAPVRLTPDEAVELWRTVTKQASAATLAIAAREAVEIYWR